MWTCICVFIDLYTHVCNLECYGIMCIIPCDQEPPASTEPTRNRHGFPAEWLERIQGVSNPRPNATVPSSSELHPPASELENPDQHAFLQHTRHPSIFLGCNPLFPHDLKFETPRPVHPHHHEPQERCNSLVEHPRVHARDGRMLRESLQSLEPAITGTGIPGTLETSSILCWIGSVCEDVT